VATLFLQHRKCNSCYERRRKVGQTIFLLRRLPNLRLFRANSLLVNLLEVVREVKSNGGSAGALRTTLQALEKNVAALFARACVWVCVHVCEFVCVCVCACVYACIWQTTKLYRSGQKLRKYLCYFLRYQSSLKIINCILFRVRPLLLYFKFIQYCTYKRLSECFLDQYVQ